MSNKIKSPLILILLFLICLPFRSYAQQYFDREAPPLTDLLQEALDKNPEVEAFRFREQAAEQRTEQVKAWEAPVLQYRYNPMAVTAFNETAGRGEGVRYTNTNFADLAQTIPFPGKIQARTAVEEARARVSSDQTDQTELELTTQVKKNYFDLWLIQQKMEVNRELQHLIDDFIESAQQLYEVERIGLDPILSAETEQAKLRTEERTLQNEYHKQLAVLNQLLYREPDTPLGQIDELPSSDTSFELAEFEQQMLTRRPDLNALRNGIKMNEAEIQLAQKNYYPDITVGVSYMDMPFANDRFGGMISVRVPIAPWSKNGVSKKIREAEFQKKSRQQALENQQSLARAQLRTAFLDLETQLDVVRLYREEVIPKAEETTESALTAFTAGRINYLNVLDSFRTLEQFRIEYYIAQAEFHKTTAKLERQAGIIFNGSQLKN